jgi:cytochrome c biogenesis protein CcmG/thiol:disulfide interchange protein DsbE
MKKKILLLPLGLFLLILLTFAYLLVIDRNPQAIPSNLINKKIPNFEANSLFKEEKFIFSQELKPEIVLINFFATWCKPCRDEHLYIKKFSEQKKIRVIGINYKDDPEKTIKWLNDLGNPYSDVLLDKKGQIAIDWGVYGIPETFVVNSNGIIKYRQAGPITKKIYRKINSLIKEIK